MSEDVQCAGQYFVIVIIINTHSTFRPLGSGWVWVIRSKQLYLSMFRGFTVKLWICCLSVL